MLSKINDLSALLEDTRDEDAESMENCKRAYDRLLRIFYNVLLPNEQIPGNMVMAWAATLTSEFRHLLRDHHPPALTLLTYFSLLLRDDSWYTKGWRFWLIDIISQMMLPSPWRECIQWANDQIQADAEFLEVRGPIS